MIGRRRRVSCSIPHLCLQPIRMPPRVCCRRRHGTLPHASRDRVARLSFSAVSGFHDGASRKRRSFLLAPRLFRLRQMAVISGVGVRRYYERFGYRTLKDYQASCLSASTRASASLRWVCTQYNSVAGFGVWSFFFFLGVNAIAARGRHSDRP